MKKAKTPAEAVTDLATIKIVGYFLAEALYYAGDIVLGFTNAVISGAVKPETFRFEEAEKLAGQRRRLRRSPIDDDASADEVRDILTNIVDGLDNDPDDEED